MKALIMAGGEGSRLRPLTMELPKPMVPIMNKPVMEHTIELLKKYNIKDIAVTLYYLPASIKDYFLSGESNGVNLKYFEEELPLGTGGSVLNALGFFNETFLVISGDSLTDINLEKAISYHKNKGSKATLILKKDPFPLKYGIVICSDSGRITKFLEKPSWGEVFSDTINTGIYILEPEVFSYFKKGDNFDFSKDLFPKLLKDNIPIYGYVASGYWNDIGDMDSYKKTHLDILKGKINIPLEAKEISQGIYVHKSTVLPKNIQICAPSYIGANCIIEDNTFIGSYTVIGDNCSLGKESKIERSILWENSTLGNSNLCRDAIICNKVITRAHCHLLEGSVVGSNCDISSNTIISNNVKVWPNKSIKKNTKINHNLIWGERKSKELFTGNGISGEINIDISPELATSLGSAFASILPKDNSLSLVVCCDNSKASLLIKQCISSGIIATGTKTISIENSTIPVCRFAIRFFCCQGGIYISQNPFKENQISIEFFNKFSGNIDTSTEKKLEDIIMREDFRRCSSNNFGEIITAENFSSIYIDYNISMLQNLEEIRKSNFKLLITSPSKMEARLTIDYLKKLNCTVLEIYPKFTPKSLEGYIHLLSQDILNSQYDMGIVLGGNGEDPIFLDDTGLPLSKEKHLLFISYILLEQSLCQHMIIPNNATKKIEELAKKYEVSVTRAKSSKSSYPYELFFDSITTLGRTIGFLAEKNLNLSKLLNLLPTFYMESSEIPCNFEERGRVISELIKLNKSDSSELIEGIKISSDKGWSLVLPHASKPTFSIYSEGFSEEYAKELASEVTDKVKEIIKEKH